MSNAHDATSRRGQWFVLGYVGAVGSPIARAISLVRSALEHRYRYVLQPAIKISALWGNPAVEEDPHAKSFKGLRRVEDLAKAMSQGNAVCKSAKMAGRLAERAADNIAPLFRTNTDFIAHIDSLKRPEEVEFLRERFGRRFFLLGIHASREWRTNELVQQISSRQTKAQVELARSAAAYLIERDESEREKREYGKFGQNVRGTLQLADAVVAGETPALLEAQLLRVLRLLFRHPFETPNVDETGMMQAAVAARQSAALGRQVGAAVYNETGDLVTTGYNEIPAVGGGHLRPGTQVDRRDYVMGWNESRRRNDRLLGRVEDVVRMVGTRRRPKTESSDRQQILPNIDLSEAPNETPDSNEHSLKDLRAGLAQAGLASLIEFGRDVHAEQSAVCTAARLGRALVGGTMYVTTFPCHLCAKHIIAAGISRVVFIEPYAKSQAEELFEGLISVDELRGGRVHFQRHIGIAPRAYFDLFDVPSDLREDENGAARQWHESTAVPWFFRRRRTEPANTSRPIHKEQSHLHERVAPAESGSVPVVHTGEARTNAKLRGPGVTTTRNAEPRAKRAANAGKGRSR